MEEGRGRAAVGEGEAVAGSPFPPGHRAVEPGIRRFQLAAWMEEDEMLAPPARTDPKSEWRRATAIWAGGSFARV